MDLKTYQFPDENIDETYPRSFALLKDGEIYTQATMLRQTILERKDRSKAHKIK